MLDISEVSVATAISDSISIFDNQYLNLTFDQVALQETYNS